MPWALSFMLHWLLAPVHVAPVAASRTDQDAAVESMGAASTSSTDETAQENNWNVVGSSYKRGSRRNTFRAMCIIFISLEAN